MKLRIPVTVALALSLAACGSSASDDSAASQVASPLSPSRAHRERAAHVLLVSVDGLHASDLARFVASHPRSTLAELTARGTTYANAFTTRPSDSFPGLLALLTGGTPRSTGVYYDDSYDRSLSPPGSACETVGTEVVFDESIDRNPDARDAGGGIDPAALPLDPAKGCAPVWPHQYVRVNNVFELAHQAGLTTAWSDKHPAYDLVRGPSGAGVDDLYTPEINAGDTTSSVAATEAYDDDKVDAVLRWIAGRTHDGRAALRVPAIFGMNFQAVSVGQKLAGNGYVDADGTPSAGLAGALEHVDAQIGRVVKALDDARLRDSTLIVVTAKHGQSPIDPAKRTIVDAKTIPSIVNGVEAGLVAHATQDDVSLVWLKDGARAHRAAAALRAHARDASIAYVVDGWLRDLVWGDPALDPRVPDLLVQPVPGVLYAKPTASKLAEHGGFDADDTHVALLVAGPGARHAEWREPVQTTQVAPTIAEALGLRARALDAVRLEGTEPLPCGAR